MQARGKGVAVFHPARVALGARQSWLISVLCGLLCSKRAWASGVAVGEGGVLRGDFRLHGFALMGRQLGQVFLGDGVFGGHQLVVGFAQLHFVRLGATLAQGRLVGVHVAAFMQDEGALRVAFRLLHGRLRSPDTRSGKAEHQAGRDGSQRWHGVVLCMLGSARAA